jgi:hypothetical protein
MPNAACILASALASVALVSAQPLGDVCPAFVPDDGIRKITPRDRIFRFEGGYVAIVNEIRLDTDGSPVAYHPENKGTTHLCNGLDPIVDGKPNTDKGPGSPCFAAVAAAIKAGWQRSTSPPFCIYGFYAPGSKAPKLACNAWGGEFGKGEIPLQGPADPATGFFISTTAAYNPGAFADDKQAKYLDSDRTAYAVIPRDLVSRHVLPRNGIAWAWNPKSNHTAAAVFGDTQNKFGEISVAFAQRLEKGTIDAISPAALKGQSPAPWPYGFRRTGEVRLLHSPGAPAVFVYFSTPPAPALTAYDPNAIDAAAANLLQRVGGADHWKQCLIPLLK